MSFLNATGLNTFWNKLKNYFVAKETGKGLSSNDYTNEEKVKVSVIPTGGISSGSSRYLCENGTWAVPPVEWSDVSSKPETFSPSSHTHGNSDITGIDASKITSGTVDAARLPAINMATNEDIDAIFDDDPATPENES